MDVGGRGGTKEAATGGPERLRDSPGWRNIHKVLVVDDDRDFCAAIERRLRPEAYKLVFALDGLRAIPLIQQERFDLVLIDVYLGENGSGLRVLEETRRIAPRTPAVMISAAPSTKIVVMAKRLGAEGFIEKTGHFIRDLSGLFAPPSTDLRAAPLCEPDRSLAEARRDHVAATLTRHGNNVSEAARRLSAPRSTVRRVLRNPSGGDEGGSA